MYYVKDIIDKCYVIDISKKGAIEGHTDITKVKGSKIVENAIELKKSIDTFYPGLFDAKVGRNYSDKYQVVFNDGKIEVVIPTINKTP